MRAYYRKLRGHVLQRLIPKSKRPLDLAGPTEIAGFLAMSAGIGESARLCADALSAARYPITLNDVSTAPEPPERIGWTPPAVAQSDAANRILHLNPPMLPRGIAAIGLGRFLSAYNIGYWAWELEVLPAEWKNAFHYMNALFVPSEFTRLAMERHSTIPITVVPHPIAQKQVAPGIRARFGIPDDSFLVSSVFAAGSSINRKNPQAMLRAFRLFEESHKGSYLLMKASGNPDRDPQLKALLDDVANAANIRIVTDILPSDVIQGIISDSDAYLSLHRSEGFGMTVAEAILHETPVVSTNWSGTVDFCDPASTGNVDYALVPVVDDHPEFSGLRHAVWAEADIAHAAHLLRQIAGDPEAARNRAVTARAYLVNYLANNTYAAALERLAESEGRGAAPRSFSIQKDVA